MRKPPINLPTTARLLTISAAASATIVRDVVELIRTSSIAKPVNGSRIPGKSI